MEIDELKKHCEESLKTWCPDRVKEEHALVLEIIAENERLQKTIHNSDYMSFGMCAKRTGCDLPIGKACEIGQNTCYKNPNNT